MYLFTSQIAQLKDILTVTRAFHTIFSRIRDLLSKAALTTAPTVRIQETLQKSRQFYAHSPKKTLPSVYRRSHSAESVPACLFLSVFPKKQEAGYLKFHYQTSHLPKSRVCRFQGYKESARTETVRQRG